MVAAAALALAGILLLVRWQVQKQGAYVVVFLDGQEYSRYPLDLDGTYTISGRDHSYNVLVIESGTVRVVEADCRNQVCVHTRPVSHAGETISCLPHRLRITVEGGEQAEYDAITN